MNIKLQCPECNGLLTDRFSCGDCEISTGWEYTLEMECCYCDKRMKVMIKTSMEIIDD